VTVMPAAIDTPLFEHGANYLGRGVKPPRPVYAPGDVARAIVRCAVRPRRERYVGSSARMQRVLHAVAPRLFERLARRLFEREHVLPAPAPATSGNVLDPMGPGVRADGGWRRAA
jgi:short-subunit dehydrogenase